MAISAEDPRDRVRQLTLVTERLSELVTLEAQAFEARRPQDAAAYMEETARLANIYRHESSRVRADPRMVADAPLAERTRLIRATEAFDAVLARQGRAIAAAKIVTEGLVQAIAEEVVALRSRTTNYGAGGVKTPDNSARAITLNKRA
jgi:hypothetical protein